MSLEILFICWFVIFKYLLFRCLLAITQQVAFGVKKKKVFWEKVAQCKIIW